MGSSVPNSDIEHVYDVNDNLLGYRPSAGLGPDHHPVAGDPVFTKATANQVLTDARQQPRATWEAGLPNGWRQWYQGLPPAIKDKHHQVCRLRALL